MTHALSGLTLDSILAVQFTVAWAGESREHTKRLGWWRTDLVDASGGGDFLTRLLPRTHAWAALEAVREAARRMDEQAREGMAEPDQMRSIYFFGFEVDERLSERIGDHKRSGVAPAQALQLPMALGVPFTADAFAAAFAGKTMAAFDVVPGGRQLKGAMPERLEDAVQRLAAALVPAPDRYPLPFYRVKP